MMHSQKLVAECDACVCVCACAGAASAGDAERSAETPANGAGVSFHRSSAISRVYSLEEALGLLWSLCAVREGKICLVLWLQMCVCACVCVCL